MVSTAARAANANTGDAMPSPQAAAVVEADAQVQLQQPLPRVRGQPRGVVRPFALQADERFEEGGLALREAVEAAISMGFPTLANEEAKEDDAEEAARGPIGEGKVGEPVHRQAGTRK